MRLAAHDAAIVMDDHKVLKLLRELVSQNAYEIVTFMGEKKAPAGFALCGHGFSQQIYLLIGFTYSPNVMHKFAEVI